MNKESQIDAAKRHTEIVGRMLDAIDRIPEEARSVRAELRSCARELGSLQAFTELAWRRGTSVQEELDNFNAEVEARVAESRASGAAP